ncbi:alpha/beta hydrolase [Phototrophicus methaneseepsis]|uniref:Alpha/beta hydrolase n=1 Tax=Phototrophicus methaneseepsis TaxID=2710758 RepID=A0A7S8E6K2_9CHLR|nr:alpha/beta hydrolase [Phototrophicus methaneseepsis]QPC81318.1 alpha/beta hydrolase [Phototrophicus methaneseepsis]
MATKTIVFIHGNFVNYECWDQWVERYEDKGYRCIAVKFPERTKSVQALRDEHPNPKVGQVTMAQTIDSIVQDIKALDEKPIIIGHSFGGQLTQQMVKRDLAAAAVAIDSVPPQGLLSFKFSFLRSTFPVLNPLNPAGRPWLMPFNHFQYAFANGMSLADQKAAYDSTIVPESLRIARGGVSSTAHIDYKKPHAPLLFIAGEIDHIMPASLNKANYKRYKDGSSSVVDFKEFPGRNHYTVIAGPGWEEVADYALDWALKHTEKSASGRDTMRIASAI